ncbi:MAG: hypothetical protein AAGA37_16710 [Actinomycetota bacterium]
MTKTTLAAFIALSVLVTACSADDDAEVADASSTTEAPATTTDAPPVTEAPATTTDAPPVTEAPATTTEAPPVTEAPNSAGNGFSMMNVRYCEILMTVVDGDGSEITEVWGTPGVDPCSDDAWYALDPAVIQAGNDASFIEMNGPRYFVVDGTVDTGDGSGGTGAASGGESIIQQFGDITMSLLATTDVSEESRSYVPDLVERTTTWTFDAGTEVYELIDPEGHVYTMQSYSLIEDRSLTIDDLATLGDQLDLPDGWTYRTRTLDEPLQVALAAEGAYVVQDDLRNSYQRNG